MSTSRPHPPSSSLPSALSHPRPENAARTSNRVRFDLHPAHTDDDAAVAAATTAATAHPRTSVDTDDGDEHDDNADDDTHALLPPSSSSSILAPGSVVSATVGGRSGFGAAFVNMANSIIGAGVIAQPYALRQAGLGAGLILMVGLAIVVDWTIRLVVVNSKLAGTGSFSATVERCYGRAGRMGIALAQWAFAFGGIVAFGIIVGDSIPPVIAAVMPASTVSSWFGRVITDRRLVTVAALGSVSLPLSLYRDISKLAPASAFALVSMLVIIITVASRAAHVPSSGRGSLSGLWIVNWSGIIPAIGVISFAFVCHHNSLLIYQSLRTPTLDRFAAVTHYATAIALGGCVAIALAGVLVFGDLTAGNILNNFPASDTMVNVARFCFGLNMLTTVPLEVFVCREVIESAFFADHPPSQWRHAVLTGLHVAAATAIAISTCDLGAVLELVGATSACALAYVLPPLCFLHLTPAAAAHASIPIPGLMRGDDPGLDVDLDPDTDSDCHRRPDHMARFKSRVSAAAPRIAAIAVAACGFAVAISSVILAARDIWSDKPGKKCHLD